MTTVHYLSYEQNKKWTKVKETTRLTLNAMYFVSSETPGTRTVGIGKEQAALSM